MKRSARLVVVELQKHQAELRACEKCAAMKGPVVVGEPVASEVLLVGQAPGVHEGELGRPFAWTAGKTMFGWFRSIGVDESEFRSRVYMAAVCRCFPGKRDQGKSGDREPSPDEVAACAPWLDRELELLAPQLALPVGKMAIAALLGEARPLADVVGRTLRVERAGRSFDAIALPHPSGASTWFRTEPGKTLLARALEGIARHPSWQRIAKSQRSRSTV